MRRRPLALFAAPLLGGAVLIVGGATGPSAAAVDPWGQRADTLIQRAMAADLDDGSTIGDSMMTVALLHRRGPDNVATSAYLQRLLSRQHTDGGFGLDQPWDTWGDGSTNPASTAYTVSMAGHAWPALRDALAAGVDYADVEGAAEEMLAKLWTIPYIPVRPGVCLAYSDSPFDRAPAGYCVWNVTAGAAATLVEAWELGLGPVDPSWVAAGVTQATVAFSNRTFRGWTYSTGSGKIQDPSHNSYTIESMLELAPGLADNFVKYNIAGRPTNPTNPYWPLAHVDLASLPTGDYCHRLDDHAVEFDAWTATLGTSSFDFDLLSQAAEKAATAAAVCGG